MFKKTFVLCLLSLSLLALAPAEGAHSSTLAGPGAAAQAQPAGAAHAPRNWEKRWLYLSANLVLDENMPKIEALLRRSSAAGYNGVLFSDVKTLSWWKLPEAAGWKANAGRLRAMTKDLGLELVVCVFPFGYAEGFLANDPNLAAGVPVKGAELRRLGDTLVVEQAAVVANGSFHEHRGDRVVGFDLQDNPGKASFIDTLVHKDGNASIRFEGVRAADKHGLGRVFQRVAVRPWQQYRIRVWMKTEHLSADILQIIALDNNFPLQYQDVVVPSGSDLKPISGAKDLTTDWIEQEVCFNSLANTSVMIGFGVWGCKGGRIWWDDLRIETVPTLNLLRRPALPLTIVAADGTVYEEGKDFNRVVDPRLGVSIWPGTFDTRHEPPAITVPAGSRIKEGERVRLSCFHTAIFYGNQVAATLDDPAIFDLCAEEVRRAKEALSPDGYFMSHDEIRCAGWEPLETKAFRTSGQLFAYNIRQCYEIASREGGGKPVYVWSDMYDPNHNARAGYYLVNNTIAHSWDGLDPRVVVMKWGTPELTGKGLTFFEGLGNRCMLAAYYDEDVKKNFTILMNATGGAPGALGVMYTTWENDYSNLEKFAKTWWGAP